MHPTPHSNPASLKRLGRYKIIRPLSKGGMALVYEARRESLAGVSPRVAIKLILPEHAGSETFKELFINEARLGASMQHQNLVAIQDFDCEEDRYYLVMEYVEGLTLRRIINLCSRHEIEIPLEVIAELGRQACDGLHYAHCAKDQHGQHLKLVHRDIKPSNIILNPQGVVKVLDFGISKGRLRKERQGSVKGTWGYMAPEQAVGKDVDPTADVFGLAVVLFELASRTSMFGTRDKEEIRKLLADDHAARMAATLDAQYAPLIRVLIRALQRDPRARYESAEAFGRALSALLGDPVTARDQVLTFFTEVEGISQGTPRPARRAAELAPAPSLHQSQVEPPPPTWWTTGMVGAATLGLLLAVAVVLVGLMVQNVEQADDSSLSELAADEPAGPAGRGAPGEARGVPVSTRRAGVADAAEEAPEPELDGPVTVKVVRPVGAAAVEETAGDVSPVPEQPDPAVDAPEVEPGLLVVGARQDAEIYIDGKYQQDAPYRAQLPPGSYAVSIVARDGRRRSVEVELVSGKRVKRIWDFDRMEWR